MFIKNELHVNSNKISRVSQILGIHRDTVKVGRDFDPMNIEGVKKLGRPAKLSVAAKIYIESITYACPETTALEIIKTLSQPPYALQLCESTINNYRHKCKFKYRPKIKEVAQTSSSLLSRVLFAYHHINVRTGWKSTIFSDES